MLVKIQVKGITVSVFKIGEEDFISLTDMLKAKDGDFFISDWLRNRNTLEYLGIKCCKKNNWSNGQINQLSLRQRSVKPYALWLSKIWL